jgi:hypothetical protein
MIGPMTPVAQQSLITSGGVMRHLTAACQWTQSTLTPVGYRPQISHMAWR